MSLFLRLTNLPAGYLFSSGTIAVVLRNDLVRKDDKRNTNS
ncbi:hypothetical protein [Longitalea luteola]|nr:hypothetical protein [Longitalea luteola]